MERINYPEQVRVARKEMIRYLVGIVSHYGLYKLKEPVEFKNIMGYSICVYHIYFGSDAIYLNIDEEEYEVDMEYLDGGYYDNVELSDASTDVISDLYASIIKQENEDPYNDPCAFIGVSDWAQHYAAESQQRYDVLKETYRL